MEPPTVIYREEQSFRQIWIWVVVIGVALIAWWVFVQLIIFGDPGVAGWISGIFMAVVALGLIGLLALARLITIVDREGVGVAFVPFTSRYIPFTEIAAVEPLRYRPIREFGGWGIRWGGRNRIAYNVSGDRGVELTLTNGQRILIGSQAPEELARIISMRLQETRPPATEVVPSSQIEREVE